jgi:hypothetical protein
MKRLMKHFDCLLAVALACCTLTACGGDDDDDDIDPPSTSTQTVREMLIGTWEDAEDEDHPDRIELRKDGTGMYMAIHAHDHSEDETSSLSWFYDEDTKILTLVLEDTDDYDIDSYLISEISSSMVIAYGVNRETLETYYTERYILKRVN